MIQQPAADPMASADGERHPAMQPKGDALVKRVVIHAALDVEMPPAQPGRHLLDGEDGEASGGWSRTDLRSAAIGCAGRRMQEASMHEGLCRQRRAVVPRGEGLPLGSFDEAWGVILRPGIAGGWGVGTSDRIVLICTSDCSDQRGSPTEQFAYFDIYIDSLE